ncbi:MAG TPA: SRPBCC family protein [Turneriella sp.]|nr:SRPBCC family protein [Turneriella sp.]
MERETKSVTHVPLPLEAAFEAFTNHNSYPKAGLGIQTKLIRPGNSEESNGLGAVREIITPLGTAREEVVGINRPHTWDYHFLKWPMPYRHLSGRMSFREVSGGTEVTWTSVIEVPDGIWGTIVGPVVQVFGDMFLKFLGSVLRDVAGQERNEK